MPRRRVYGSGRLAQRESDNKLAFFFLNLASSQEYADSKVKDYLEDMMQYGFELELYIQDAVHPEVTYAYGQCKLQRNRTWHWLDNVRQRHSELATNSEYLRQKGYSIGFPVYTSGLAPRTTSGEPVDPDPKRMRIYTIDWVGEPVESKPGILQSLFDSKTPVRITVQESLDIDTYFGEAKDQAEILGEPMKCRTEEAPR